MSGKDLLGRELTETEERLMAAYEQLKALLEAELPPVAEANVREALASLWQAAHGLALTDDRPLL